MHSNLLMTVMIIYSETRYRAVGYIGDRLHHIVFTIRKDNIRLISLRKANTREVKKYAIKFSINFFSIVDSLSNLFYSLLINSSTTSLIKLKGNPRDASR